MFVKLRTARYLKARADASGVTVGYSGVAATYCTRSSVR